MSAKFVKMEGLGNTFIVVKGPLILTSRQVALYCGENGVDGLLVVAPLDKRQVEMKYWNSDGSVAEMCGNGLRCVARFAVENGLVTPGEFSVKTDAGLLKVVWDGKDSNNIEAQIGRVKFNTAPVTLQGLTFYVANVGNPHAITFVDDTKVAQVRTIGPEVEADSYFPSRTNVEFVQILTQNKIRLRTWERGVGETKACGTGMVAAAAASVEIKHTQYPMEVEVLGGTAKVWLDNDNYVWMIGPAEVVS